MQLFDSEGSREIVKLCITRLRTLVQVDILNREIDDAVGRVQPHATRTPVLLSTSVRNGDAPAYLKCENLQRTGSFKMRGALNKILWLAADVRERGIVAASTGNHGAAIGEALRLVGGRGTVVVSHTAAPYKVQRLRDTGLRVVVDDGDALSAERTARAMAEREGLVYVSPYNDMQVVAGQGTVGVELAEQIPGLRYVFVPVGGGGLVSGVAAALKTRVPSVRVVACWPQHAPSMYAAMRAGRAIDVAEQPTISDATAGGIENDAITIALCAALIDDCVLVPEHAIVEAMRDVLLRDHLVIEGAAGVAVAGFRQYARTHSMDPEHKAAIILCGGQVASATLTHVLSLPLPA